MENVIIEIIDDAVLNKIAEHRKVDGRLFLDTEGGMKLTRKLSTKLGENEISLSSAFPSKIKMTPRNRAILGVYPNVEIKTLISYAGREYERTAFIAKVSLSDKSYQIKWQGEFWEEYAKEMTIADVFRDDDVITWDDATVGQLMQNETYGGSGELLDALSSPFDYYGGYLLDQADGQPIDIIKEDLRIKVHPLFILQRFAERIGWGFECPLYKSQFGKVQSRYLLKSDYYDYERGQGLRAKTFLQGSALMPSPASKPTPQNNLVYGATAAVEQQGYRFTNPYPYEIEVEVSIKGTVIPNVLGLTYTGIIFNCKNQDGTGANLVLEPIPNDNPIKIDTAASNIIPASGSMIVECAFLDLNPNSGASATIQDGMEIEIKVTSKHFVRGDQINMSDVFSNKVTVFDFFQAESHLFNFIPTEDETNKNLTLEIPYDVEVYNEDVKGIFQGKRTPEKIKGNLCEGITLSSPKASKLPKFYDFKFKQGDSEVERQKESGTLSDNPLGIKIETESLGSSTKGYENKLFVASALRVIPIRTADNGIYSSWHVVTDEGISYEVRPRCTMNKYSTQKLGETESVVLYEGGQLTKYLVSYQVPQEGFPYSLSFNHDTTLYDLFYKQYLTLLNNSLDYSANGTMTALEFARLKETVYYLFEYAGDELVGRIVNASHEDGKIRISLVVE